jgi:hypothetical protein
MRANNDTQRLCIYETVSILRSQKSIGSRALQSWARAQINIVPTDEDDNGKLIFFCGKK